MRGPVLIFLLFLSHFSFSQCEVLIWSDEFDGTGAPNSSNWGYDLGGGGWGNQEVQTYTNSSTNIRQENGNLVIDAIKSGGNWTSARIKTQGKKNFTYGKIVYRAKLPTGVGTWPALWMLGSNISSVGWPACGEIDVMEHVGKNQNVVQSALHTPSSNGNTQNKGSKTVSTASTEFHEYSVSWNATRMVFSVDNVPFYTYNPSSKTPSTWPFDASQFIIINLAMGGTFGGPVDPALTSAHFEVDYVRVYEERSAPVIQGSPYLFENQQGVQYSAPDYGGGITYNWTVPGNANITGGQGTKDITVNWGDTDGTIGLDVTGETGCVASTASLNVTTIIEPTGLKYTVDNFSNMALPGWTKNDNGITMSASSNQLAVSYNVSSLKYIQYEMTKAVHLSDYGILKVPVMVPASSAVAPALLLTVRDGNGNETISTGFEITTTKKDGEFYTYSYNFNGLWSLNNPAVNDNLIKFIRIYMPSGQGSYKLGAIEFFNSKTIPEPPSNLTATITDQGRIALDWGDETNATSFNIYRSDSPTDAFVKIKSNIKTSEVPYSIIPTKALNYYKLTGVNSVGESVLSTELEVVVDVTATEAPMKMPVSVYPNPCNGRFFIQTNGEVIRQLKIFDATGIESTFDWVTDHSLTIVNMKSIHTGNYFLIIQQDSKTLVVKVVVNP